MLESTEELPSGGGRPTSRSVVVLIYCAYAGSPHTVNGSIIAQKKRSVVCLAHFGKPLRRTPRRGRRPTEQQPNRPHAERLPIAKKAFAAHGKLSVYTVQSSQHARDPCIPSAFLHQYRVVLIYKVLKFIDVIKDSLNLTYARFGVQLHERVIPKYFN
jgi:hypothetical protein